MGLVKEQLDEQGYFDDQAEDEYLQQREKEEEQDDSTGKHKDIFDIIDDIQEKAQILKKLVDEL